MRNLFLLILAGLIIFSQVLNYQSGTGPSGLPVVYWVADDSSYRRAQFSHFTNWLRETGAPRIEFRLDPANNNPQKVIVQGVAGTAGDIIQVFHGQVRFMAEIGILDDLNPIVKDLGIDTNQFFPALRDYLYLDGKLLGIPANSGLSGPYMVNAKAFADLGMPPPPERWNFDDFERIGKEYMARSARKYPRRDHYFVNGVHGGVMRNSLGVGIFNETLTAPTITDPRNLAINKLIKRWTYEDRIVPTPAERDSLNQEGDNYGGNSGLLHRGHYAMMLIGRWHFCTTRFISTDVPYRCVAHPDGGFLNHVVGVKMNALYKGGKKKDLAKHFFKWMSSDAYNRFLVDQADGEPPDSRYFTNEAYLRPAKYTNEWAYNAVLSRLMLTTAVPDELCPYALPGVYNPKIGKTGQAYASGVITAEQMIAEQDAILRETIQDHLKRHPELKARYAAACERQKEIDALKAAGKKIPLALVENQFLKIYYQKTGLGI